MSSSRAGTVRKIGTRAESATARKFLAEIIGTAFLTFIGGSCHRDKRPDRAWTRALTEADLGIIGLSFAFALAISVYSIGKVSGCHVNPAITIALLATRRIEAWLAGVYIAVAQFIGATIGALGIILVFGPAAAKVAGDMGVTSFASPTNAIQAAAIEAVGTFIFMFVITAMAADYVHRSDGLA